MLTCSRSPHAHPVPRTSADRIAAATRRATATSGVTSHTLYATSTGRAPTQHAPAVGCGAGGPVSGARSANARRRTSGSDRSGP